MSELRRILALALFLVGVAHIALGQGITTGTVAATITDPSGAVVPGAKINLTNTENGINLTSQSGPEGSVVFHAVPIGTYKVSVAAAGFAVTNIDKVAVNSGATTDLGKISVTVGASEQVVVNGSTAALLETSDSQVTTTFDTQAVQNLPLNNGFDTAVELIPGVVSTHSDNFSNTNGDNFAVNGQSGRYNNFEVDGQSNNDNSIGGPQLFFGSQDAIQQLQVITNDYSAQYGRNAGAVVNYITKSGSNSFHGSGFDFYQGSFLSSLPNQDKNPLFGFCAKGESGDGCTTAVVPRFVENRYGATIGGPILKDKLFFFGSTYWDRLRQGAAPSSSLPSLTPDPNGLQQLQAIYPNNPSVAGLVNFGPYAVKQGNPQPIPGTATLEAITGPDGVSHPVEFAGVSRTIPSLFNDEEELGRLDWQPTAKDHVFLRYFYQTQLSTGVAGTSIAAGDYVDVPATSHSIGADWSHAFSERLVDQLRYSFQESKVYFQGGAYPTCTVNNLAGCPTQITFNGSNDDLGFGVDTVFPQGRTVKVTQVQNNATWTRGRHTLIFGGEYDYQNSPNGGLFFYNGNLNFGTFDNYLQNGPGGLDAYILLADGPPVIPFTEPDVAAYAQDDWKVTPNLTVHLGMRWEFFSQAVNKLHDLTAAREANASTAFWDTTLPLADRTVPAADQRYKNFEPRIGFAWNPDFDRKLVVRGGYAINANPAFYNMFLLVAGGAPAVNFNALACDPASSACVPSNGSLTGASVRAANLPGLPTGIDPRSETQTTFPTNFRTPYVQTYTLAFEHQIGRGAVGEVRYVGSKTTDDFQSVDGNPFLLPVATAFPNRVSASSLCSDPNANGFGRPNCNFNNVSLFTNGGWASYNGLLLNLTTQNYHGVTSTVSYTWSKALNNATDAFRSTGGGGSTIAYPQNPLDTSAGERGLSGNDFRNVIGLDFNYQVPTLIKGNGLLGRAANGFQLTGIYRYNSGQWYTPYQHLTVDTNNGDSSFCDATFNASTVGVDSCRLVVSNRKAAPNSVAYLNPYTGTPDADGNPTLGTPMYVAYKSDGYDSNGVYFPGTPIDPQSAHFIINNQAYAQAVNNPYPGFSRGQLQGQAFSDFDASIIKTTRLTEHVSMQLSLAAYNVLNQMYLGSGVASVSSSAFTKNSFNSSGSISGNSSGNRFFVLGGKIVF